MPQNVSSPRVLTGSKVIGNFLLNRWPILKEPAPLSAVKWIIDHLPINLSRIRRFWNDGKTIIKPDSFIRLNFDAPGPFYTLPVTFNYFTKLLLRESSKLLENVPVIIFLNTNRLDILVVLFLGEFLLCKFNSFRRFYSFSLNYRFSCGLFGFLLVVHDHFLDFFRINTDDCDSRNELNQRNQDNYRSKRSSLSFVQK